jgi:hypothetical protein
MPILPFIEIMITQTCNLACHGCTNYSDLYHRGYVTWNQGRSWFEQWRQRLILPDIGIIGGEPLINPEWRAWLYGLRQMFPDSQLRFTTNGLLLNRNPDIMDVMFDIGNVVFKITVHVADKDLEQWIELCHREHSWKLIQEFGMKRWIGSHDVRFQVNRPSNFNLPFRGNYHDMRPWNSDPDHAFAQCIQQTCPLLYKGRIYKCSTSALLSDTLERFDNPNYMEWQPFITTGIGIDNNDQDLIDFVNRFGIAESICAQCPDSKSGIVNHMRTVKFKRKKNK